MNRPGLPYTRPRGRDEKEQPNARLRGQVALVTGGGAGIGRAVCIRLASEGAAVVILEQHETNGLETAQTIAAAGGIAELVVGDVAVEASCTRAAETCAARFGRLDVLVANAGIEGPMRDITSVSVDEWDRLMAVNVRGAFLSAKASVPLLRAAGGGAIVVMSSNYAFVAAPHSVPYCTSKGATMMLTRALAVDLVSDNIRVNAVCPGNVATPMFDRSLVQQGLDPSQFKASIGRMASPEEVAGVVAFLCSGDARYMTGAAVMVDYGESVRPGPVWGNPAW